MHNLGMVLLGSRLRLLHGDPPDHPSREADTAEGWIQRFSLFARLNQHNRRIWEVDMPFNPAQLSSIVMRGLRHIRPY
jgi:hypothetical protein